MAIGTNQPIAFDLDNTLSLPLFAAHLYYRGLVTAPSLFRTWLLDCKDYTLSTSVANYTSQHFSPVIIGHELGHVKSPEVTTELNSDNFVVKVASNTNEVTGVFTVDEQQLEIILKIPTDWPLHGIEVKESKRVGVTENRWRGWLLGTQQIVMYQVCGHTPLAVHELTTSQNGHIADALSLFKKNVSLHFEGLIECAICYSYASFFNCSICDVLTVIDVRTASSVPSMETGLANHVRRAKTCSTRRVSSRYVLEISWSCQALN